MNKLGEGYMILFFAFIVIMLILTGGIIWGTGAFYGKGYEFRHAEARLLAEQVKDCFTRTDSNKFFEQDFNIFSTCRLDKNTLEEEHLIYITSQDSPEHSFTEGVANYMNECFFEAARSNPNYPRCVNGTIIKNGERFYFVVGSNQKGKKT